MKKIIPVLFILMLTTGCSDFCGWVDNTGLSSSPSSTSSQDPDQQLAESMVSFEQKINDSKGMSLAALRSKWGNLEPGISRDNLTVYRWSQTARLTNPQGKDKSTTVSCLAMFIVDPKGVVVDAASEGRCYDYKLLRSWKPVVTQSTDGKTGVVY